MEKKRTCLRCDKLFMSKSIGNRICPACSGRKGEKTDVRRTRKKLGKQLKRMKMKPESWHTDYQMFSAERNPDD